MVAIDPTRQTVPAGETTTINFLGTPRPNSLVVGIGSFHYYQLDQQAVDAAKAAGIQQLDVGDYMVLVATHITTKEIDDWVWGTVWWHDRPDVGAYAMDRPASVKGVWRNYLMSASYDLETPTATDGKAHITYNPYLEARFPNGQVSNCMNCHNRASWPEPFFLPVFRGKPAANDPAYKAGQLRTDFLWSIPDRAQPRP